MLRGVAAHYQQAYELAPDDEDAAAGDAVGPRRRRHLRPALEQALERAANIAVGHEVV